MRPQRRDSTLHPFDHRRVNRHPATVSAHLQDDWLIYARVLRATSTRLPAVRSSASPIAYLRQMRTLTAWTVLMVESW